MKRTVIAFTLALALSAPVTAAFAAPGNGKGPRYNCTSPNGSTYEGVTHATAKDYERSDYVCVRLK